MSTSGSESVRFPKENGKRPRVCDDAELTYKAQAPNETIDLNDTLASFLNGPLSRNIFRGKTARLRLMNHVVFTRSETITRGSKKTRPRSTWSEKIALITTDSRCETNSASKANYEHGVETYNTTFCLFARARGVLRRINTLSNTRNFDVWCLEFVLSRPRSIEHIYPATSWTTVSRPDRVWWRNIGEAPCSFTVLTWQNR